MKSKVPVEFLFKPTIVHKGGWVFRGGFSDEISGNDSDYFEGKVKFIEKITLCKPKSDSENAVYTCNVLNDFLDKERVVLENHKVNKERIRRGLLPANKRSQRNIVVYLVYIAFDIRVINSQIVDPSSSGSLQEKLF